jgi:hypothetical protein
MNAKDNHLADKYLKRILTEGGFISNTEKSACCTFKNESAVFVKKYKPYSARKTFDYELTFFGRLNMIYIDCSNAKAKKIYDQLIKINPNLKHNGGIDYKPTLKTK